MSIDNHGLRTIFERNDFSIVIESETDSIPFQNCFGKIIKIHVPLLITQSDNDTEHLHCKLFNAITDYIKLREK